MKIQALVQFPDTQGHGKLRRLPFAIRNAVSQERQRLEKDGVIERIDSSPWVSPIVVVKPNKREPNKAVVVDMSPIERMCSMSYVEEIYSTLLPFKMLITRCLFTQTVEVSLVSLVMRDFFDS